MNTNNDPQPYHMITAQWMNNEIEFPSEDAFSEAMKIGFFRLPVPKEIDLEVGRLFARSFPEDTSYNNLGSIGVINGFYTGFLVHPLFQAVRFQLDKEQWNLFPEKVQVFADQIHSIGVKVIQHVLKVNDVPREIWQLLSSGASEFQGSHSLCFNNYNPKDGEKEHGIFPHQDWSIITVLDATQEGLQVEIDEIWRAIHLEEGYLTINFGLSFTKLLPQIKASMHRVVPQKNVSRISVAAFISPLEIIRSWDSEKKEISDNEPILSFHKKIADAHIHK